MACSRACELAPGHKFVYGQLRALYSLSLGPVEARYVYQLASVSVFAAVQRGQGNLPRVDARDPCEYLVPFMFVSDVSVMFGHVTDHEHGVLDVMADDMEFQLTKVV